MTRSGAYAWGVPVPADDERRRVLQARQLWEDVARLLREDILDGTLPPGSRLVETDLAERFGVSRGPVREALRELERIGLVTDRPRRGVFVSTPSETDVDEIMVVRESLETSAARMACGKLLAGDLVRLEQVLQATEAAYATGNRTHGVALDLAFHREIFAIAGNSRMLRAHDDLSSQLLLAWTSDPAALRDEVTPPVAHHRGIFDALAAGDPEAVAAAISVHYGWRGDRLIG